MEILFWTQVLLKGLHYFFLVSCTRGTGVTKCTTQHGIPRIPTSYCIIFLLMHMSYYCNFIPFFWIIFSLVISLYVHIRKANWIGHILRRNCLLKQVTEGKVKGEMEVARRRGRRRKKLLDDLKDRRGYSHLKEEALDRTVWRHHFGRGVGPVVRQNTEWMDALLTAG